MAPSAQPDRLSNLPDGVLVMIISCLPFKECVRTSTLAKSWRFLYRETRNVAFKQWEFVSPFLYDQPRLFARDMVAFTYHMNRWIARSNDHPVDSLKIAISDPEIFLNSIQALMAFAARKRVKKLILDFSMPMWGDSDDVDVLDLVVEVPESVYNLTSLESLKVYACKDFDPSRFVNPGNFRSLSFGWMRMETLEPFLSKCSRLDSLRIRDCWDLGFTRIAGNMREFAFENCDLYFSCTFDMPKLEIFRYSGDIFSLKFRRKNMLIKEIYLDFELGDDGETYLDVMTLCDNLNRLPPSGTLTLSPDALQLIQKSEPPHLIRRVKAQHLVLRTRLRPNEIDGIWLLLNSCPNIKTLTFEMLPPSSDEMALSQAGIDPQTCWMQNVTFKCMRETLKVLVIRNFVGGPHESYLVKNVIRCRRAGGPPLLRRVELYVPSGLNESQKRFAFAKAGMLRQRENDVQLRVQTY